MSNDSNLPSNDDKIIEKIAEIGIQSEIQSGGREQETVTLFPLLSLPDEIIGYIYSFLPIKDRMRARLCKRLDNVEMEHKYYVPRFIIDEMDAQINIWKKLLRNDITNRGFPIESLKRIMRNATFGFMSVNITGDSESIESFEHSFDCALNIYYLLLECNIVDLKITFPFSMMKDIMMDEFFFRLINACCKLRMGCTGKISAAGLQTLHKRVMDRTCKLHFVDFDYAPVGLLKEFLLLIGIKYEGGNLFSERNVEAYNFKDVMVKAEDNEEGEEVFRMNKHVFDDNLEMIFGHDEDDTTGWLSMNYHRTKEDLMKAKTKKGLVRFEL